MSVAIVTGSAGLIGSEACRHFARLGLDIVGIDNNMREYFFGSDGSTEAGLDRLRGELDTHYTHSHTDIRDRAGVQKVFRKFAGNVALVIHAAAQPSHDWAVKEPFTDFDVNAVGTLNVLEAARAVAPEAPFIFCSTNKVYGDSPNRLPLVELETRYEITPGHPYSNGIAEDLSIDASLHSLFGSSKLAADVLVQEYGRYFGMPTVCFRGGTLTGPGHAAAELHGFLGYLMRCVMEGREYKVFGYKGKMVRDAIHAHDVLTAFEVYFRDPRPAAVYNIGGGRFSNTSHIEAFNIAQELTGKEARVTYLGRPRIGDHQWWISDTTLFERDYPAWKVTYDIPRILAEIYEANSRAWHPGWRS